MKKVLSFVLILIIIVAIVIALLFSKGFGLGFGSGSGSNSSSDNNTAKSFSDSTTSNTSKNIPETSNTATPSESSEPSSKTIVISVEKSEYKMNDKTVLLSDIEAFITKNETFTYIIEDNYASAKAWDEIQKLFSENEIPLIEE